MTELMALLVVVAAAGYVMRRVGLVRPELASDLSKVVFHFTLPLLIFHALYTADLAWSMLLMPAAAWTFLLLGLGAGLIVTRLVGMRGPLAGSFIIVCVFGNTTFFGYPIVRGFYGDEGLTLAIFYDLLGASLIVNTLGLLLASTLGGGNAVKVKEVARRLLVFPPIWGLVLGLALRPVDLPSAVENVIETLGGLTTPIIMLSIGLSLRFSAWREHLGLVMIATAVRLALFPLVAWLLLTAAGMPVEMLRVAVMQAAMPTMFFSLTLALLFGLRKTLVVNTIMLSTVISFATLPAWRWFLGP